MLHGLNIYPFINAYATGSHCTMHLEKSLTKQLPNNLT